MTADDAITCPHLGTKEDGRAFYRYASKDNRCYHCLRPATPLPSHQETHCLTDAHKDCPAFLQAAVLDFPAELRGERAQEHAGWSLGLRVVLAVAIGLMLLGFGGWRYYAEIFGARLVIPMTGRPALAVSTEAVPVAAATGTATAVPTWTAAPTPTPLPPAGTHGLEVPFEIEGHTLLMHHVAIGETFDEVDTKYGTTADVIRALNYSAQASLLANTVIVVAPGMEFVDASLPMFRVRRVEDAPAVTIDQAATLFNVEAADMRRYNGCTDDCRLVVSDWILVPVSQP